MKAIVLIFFALASVSVLANDNTLTAEDIRNRLEVKGETYLFDSTGTRILEKDSGMSIWRPRLVDGKAEIKIWWGGPSIRNQQTFIFHQWLIQSDGTIKMTIEEYARQEEYTKPNGKKDTRFADLIKREERLVENLQQINWVSAKSGKERFVIRFTPSLNDDVRPRNVADLPVSGTDIQITDNEGNLWLEHAGLNGRYVGFSSHKGSLYLSYYPFKGAKEMGVAAGNKIELKLGGTKTATLTSQTAFVPDGMRLIVYGVHDPSKRTSRISSVHTMATDKEKNILHNINKKIED